MDAIRCAVCERIAILRCAGCKRYFCGLHSRVLWLQHEEGKRETVQAYCFTCKPASREN
jgi:hypothetical protein